MNPLTRVILSRITSGLSVTPFEFQLAISDLDQAIASDNISKKNVLGIESYWRDIFL